MLPIDLYPRILQAITLISQGITITRACDEADVTVASFLYQINNTPEFREAYIDAEQRGYDRLAEALLTINRYDLGADKAPYASSDPKEQAVLSKNIMWFLSKKRPAVYGDRITVAHEITADKVIIAALEAGQRRAIEANTRGGNVIDADYEIIETTAFADDDVTPFL